jgi:hypothetical protein
MPFNEMYVFDFLLNYMKHPSSRSHDSFIEIDELPTKLDFNDIQMRLNTSSIDETTSNDANEDKNISSSLTS